MPIIPFHLLTRHSSQGRGACLLTVYRLQCSRIVRVPHANVQYSMQCGQIQRIHDTDILVSSHTSYISHIHAHTSHIRLHPPSDHGHKQRSLATAVLSTAPEAHCPLPLSTHDTRRLDPPSDRSLRAEEYSSCCASDNPRVLDCIPPHAWRASVSGGAAVCAGGTVNGSAGAGAVGE